jgi:hypothetical protein
VRETHFWLPSPCPKQSDIERPNKHCGATVGSDDHGRGEDPWMGGLGGPSMSLTDSNLVSVGNHHNSELRGSGNAAIDGEVSPGIDASDEMWDEGSSD